MVLVGVLAIACKGEPVSKQRTPQATVTDGTWRKFDSERILFAHQSVGRNIISGLQQLRAGSEGPPLHVHDLATGRPPAGPVLMHMDVGQNGDPSSKIRHFRELLEGGLGKDVDVAMLKFCFWDIRRDTNVDAVFAEYQSTVAALEKEFPSVHFVHATVPLMTADLDWRASVRRIIGRPVPTTLDNQARHRLSTLIRSNYAGKRAIFDLEAAEAADDDEDGSPYLAADLTTDGGHLNDAGQRRLAAQFVAAIANQAGQPLVGPQ
jgi:hypothetical protein